MQGDYDEAMALFQRAVAGAEAAQAEFDISATSPHQSPWLLGETLASAKGGLGQVAAMQKDWDKAEDILSQVAPSTYVLPLQPSSLSRYPDESSSNLLSRNVFSFCRR